MKRMMALAFLLTCSPSLLLAVEQADKTQIFDKNYALIIDYKESGQPGLQMTVNTAGSLVTGSELTTGGDILSFKGKIKATSTAKIFVEYDISVRDYVAAKETYVDAGTQGSVLLDLGKPMTISITSERQFEITVKKK